MTERTVYVQQTVEFAVTFDGDAEDAYQAMTPNEIRSAAALSPQYEVLVQWYRTMPQGMEVAPGVVLRSNNLGSLNNVTDEPQLGL
jgi:hypothetical protein